jgi:hypothetical protein
MHVAVGIAQSAVLLPEPRTNLRISQQHLQQVAAAIDLPQIRPR